jgi:hypothetical protein
MSAATRRSTSSPGSASTRPLCVSRCRRSASANQSRSFSASEMPNLQHAPLGFCCAATSCGSDGGLGTRTYDFEANHVSTWAWFKTSTHFPIFASTAMIFKAAKDRRKAQGVHDEPTRRIMAASCRRSTLSSERRPKNPSSALLVARRAWCRKCITRRSRASSDTHSGRHSAVMCSRQTTMTRSGKPDSTRGSRNTVARQALGICNGITRRNDSMSSDSGPGCVRRKRARRVV